LRKYIILTAAWGVLLATGAACRSAYAPELREYRSEAHGFAIELPVGWEQREGYLDSSVTAISPDRGGGGRSRASVNVVVDRVDADMSPDEYWAFNRSDMAGAYDEFRALDNGEVTIAGQPWRYLLYTFRTDGTAVKGLAYVTLHNRRGYVVNLGSAAGQFDKWRATFERVAESVRLLDAAPESRPATPPGG
jgi:hypothetical protein